ncbi:YkgJ family cysteine cluster protein [Desulfonema magnum]|uniref:Zinc- or iron-chelating domain-containing protein n=1 Tax=Desulfonema magnum TaxID=45655 RepID=A0A975BWF2_9BACT|nr:YkgJ family cysteine cluster protein [Desulfonema magnum]QTA92747.1 Putative zinc- or iron-chelating domain-containing protein [Desulfonema magnum]
MNIDFTPFFKKYEELLGTVEGVFERVKSEYPECVKCEVGCSDCCHALFDLTLIEVLYINHHFNKKFEGKEKAALIEKANRADRNTYKIKRKAYKDFESGKSEDEILVEMAEERVRCPLLNDRDMCDLYEWRPITCRFYGIPTSIGGTGHTCGKSGFVKGEQYPTVHLDIIQNKLYEISDELVKAIESKYTKMADMLVPLSMAILTDYDEEYLGIGSDEDKEKKNE